MKPPASRAAIERLLFWLLPPLVCLAAYYPAFQVWFLHDDFSWLALRRLAADSAHPLATMFAPYAQGTVRFLSERLFFVAFSTLFDLNAIPFRIWIFLTQFANLALAAWLGARLTGSRAAGCAAACLWAISAGMATPMYWTSAYNQILCAFFLLAALASLERYIETGKRVWLVVQYAAFLLSFGALEIGVVYPAIATFWTWFRDRSRLKSTLALWPLAIAFTAAHFLLIPKRENEIYRLYFDRRMFYSFAQYAGYAIGPSRLGYIIGRSVRWYGFTIAIALCAASGVFAIANRTWRIAFCFLWFAAFIAPVLPLANHVSDYYVAVPMVGVCWALGWTLTAAWQWSSATRVMAVALAAAYAITSIWMAHETTLYFAAYSRPLKNLVQTVVLASAKPPQKIVLLNGVTNDLYKAGFDDDPFAAAGVKNVFLAPGTESGLEARADLGRLARYVISPDRALRALDQNQAIVVQVSGTTALEVTAAYRAIQQSRRSKMMRRTVMELGDAGSADLLGDGWYPAEDGFRWMATRATLRLAAPQSPGERLYLDGYVPAGVLAGGPVRLSVKINGRSAGSTKLDKPGALFTADFAIPASGGAQSEITIELEVSRTFHPPNDLRDLGVILSKIAVR